MDRSEGDDELYPDAPVPEHERGWRHQSEIGQAAWANSEPPLTIGRGLSAATGAVGALLAMAVLWAIVPTHAGRGVGVSALGTTASTATTLADDTTPTTPPGTIAPPTTSAPALTTPLLTTTAPTTAASNTSHPATSTLRITTTTLDIEHPTSATYAIEQATPKVPNAVAVAIDNGSLVLTTANAVSRGDNVALLTDDGDSAAAHVVMIDARDGLAVLQAETPTSTPPLRIADAVVKGDVLTFYDDEHSVVVVGDGGTVEPSWPADRMREGTPVLNQRGELVALCTHGEGGVRLVLLPHLAALRATLAADAASRTVWTGITFGQQPDSLRITAVAMKSPAEAAGVKAGDIITAVDGHAVGSREQLAAALRLHHPGDAVDLSIVDSEATSRVVTIVLATPPTAP
jgi:S1-C subfamily serine protease